MTNLLEVGGKTQKIIMSTLRSKMVNIGHCIDRGQKLTFQTQTSTKLVPKMSALTFFYTMYHVKGAKKRWSSCYAGNIFPRLKRGPIRVKSQSNIALKQEHTTTWNGHKRHKDGLNTVRTWPTQD